MKNLVILIGPPGSGKTTLAKTKYADHVRISQDDQGKQGHVEAFLQALIAGQDIVVDRLNFSQQQRDRYIESARDQGYHITHHILFVPSKVCRDRMTLRTDHPTIKDDESANAALNHFFRWFEYPRTEPLDVVIREGQPDPTTLPKAIICDLDGTLCNIDHRLHHVRGPGKKNWMVFAEGAEFDDLNAWCADILHAMLTCYDCNVIFCSGRSEEYRRITEEWLDIYVGLSDPLFMRPAKDYRDDALVKEIILDFEILPQYQVLLAIDDRQRVVDMWRRRGITTLQCAPGDF
jgi:predicted kinase